MSEINDVKGYTQKTIEAPDSVEKATICYKCGLLAIDGVCDSVNKYGTNETGNFTREEYFEAGTVPQEYCICHRSLFFE